MQRHVNNRKDVLPKHCVLWKWFAWRGRNLLFYVIVLLWTLKDFSGQSVKSWLSWGNRLCSQLRSDYNKTAWFKSDKNLKKDFSGWRPAIAFPYLVLLPVLFFVLLPFFHKTTKPKSKRPIWHGTAFLQQKICQEQDSSSSDNYVISLRMSLALSPNMAKQGGPWR